LLKVDGIVSGLCNVNVQKWIDRDAEGVLQINICSTPCVSAAIRGREFGGAAACQFGQVLTAVNKVQLTGGGGCSPYSLIGEIEIVALIYGNIAWVINQRVAVDEALGQRGD
jgi:hypothetical protein